MIKDLKFNSADFSGKDISSLPDRPGDSGITGAELKARFDQIPKMMVALGGFNSLIDELNGNNGAENIGVSPIEGAQGATVQAVLGEMGALTQEAKTAAETAAAQGRAAEAAAQNAAEAASEATVKATAAETAANTAAEQGEEAAAAATAATAAILEVKTYAEEQAQSAKDYVDNVILSGGAVTSVFGRAGAVTAQSGDYTAAMVGAIPAEEKGTAGGVASLGSDGKVPSAQLPEIGAVKSVFGRTGEVKAQSGDYTAAMVGARPASWTPSASDVGAIPTSEKGAPNGVATLGEDGLVPENQLPEIGAVKSVNGFTGEIQLYTYGTEDITAGTSPLPTGTLYFVYE